MVSLAQQFSKPSAIAVAFNYGTDRLRSSST
jgi:hypothetical protein